MRPKLTIAVLAIASTAGFVFAAQPQAASTTTRKPVPAATNSKPAAGKSAPADTKSTTAKSTAASSTATKSTAAKATSAKAMPAKSVAANSTPAKLVPAKSIPAKPATVRKTTAAKTTAPPVRHYAQQQPTTDRYKDIQQALADRGYFKGSVDGQWGQESIEALKQFQREQKIDEDGKISSLALIALGLGPHRNLPENQSARSANPLQRPPSPPAETQAALESNTNATPGP